MRRLKISLGGILTFAFVFFVYSEEADLTTGLTPVVVQKIEQKYGDNAKKRIVAWKSLIVANQAKTENQKLAAVNEFFNRIPYMSDRSAWQQTDYWASPIEFLVFGHGDCEDYSIAKFFTLLALGMPEDRLQITYVTLKEVRSGGNENLAHMVLTYFGKDALSPLVLDNLTYKILPADKRPDLTPVYSFNGEGLWLSKQRERGRYLGSAERIKRWADLNNRTLTDLGL